MSLLLAVALLAYIIGLHFPGDIDPTCLSESCQETSLFPCQMENIMN
jgi:hypothetical protein